MRNERRKTRQLLQETHLLEQVGISTGSAMGGLCVCVCGVRGGGAGGWGVEFRSVINNASALRKRGEFS